LHRFTSGYTFGSAYAGIAEALSSSSYIIHQGCILLLFHNSPLPISFNSKLKSWRYCGVKNCLGLVVASRQSCPGQFADLTSVLVNYKIDLGE
jgi:hypothetical protein